MDVLGNLDYAARLRHLDLPTLKYRRHRGDMIEIWKHFNVYRRDILPASFKPSERPSRQHSKLLFQHRPADGVLGVQHNNFYYRTVTMWNRLPSEVVEANTMDQFKKRLDKHWKNAAFKFDPTEPPPHPSYNVSLVSAA